MYYVLASKCNLHWNELKDMDHFMVGIYWQQACYDDDLEQYRRRLASPF